MITFVTRNKEATSEEKTKSKKGRVLKPEHCRRTMIVSIGVSLLVFPFHEISVVTH